MGAATGSWAGALHSLCAWRSGGGPQEEGVLSPPAPQGVPGTRQSAQHFCLVWFLLIVQEHILRADLLASAAKDSMPMTSELVGE